MTGLQLDPGGGYLRDVLAKTFTDRQIEIARHELRPQLVVAGAGSGKTTVMAARIVHAVAVQHIPPSQILGLTFTNKAAGELGARVRSSLAQLEDAGALPPNIGEDGAPTSGLVDLPTVATYNAYAAGIVRDHALRIGREPGLVLMSEATRWQLALRVVRRARGPFEHLTWKTEYTAQRVLAMAGELSEHLVTTGDVRRHDTRLLAEAQAATVALDRPPKALQDLIEAIQARDDLLRLIDDYLAAKADLDVIDFGDQVALAAEIVRRAPAVAALERSRFRLVVLDEYQDTGVAQRVLLSTLYGDGHPVVAVGDPNQAIYGWRGASLGNLVNFHSHFSGATESSPQSLMTSFRCGGRILTAANTVAGPIGAITGRRRLDVAPLTPRDGGEDSGEVRIARVTTDRDEAAWIAEALAAEVAAGTAPGEIAVLARRRSDFGRLHRALLERDLPVEVVGLGGLLQMPEVADVVATLTLMSDPAANAAAIRVLTGPRWRLGIRDLAALGARAGHLARKGVSGDIAEVPSPVQAGLAEALADVTARSDEVDVPSLLDAVDSPGDAAAYSAEGFARLGRLHAELNGLRRLTGQPLVDLVTEVVRAIGLDVEIEAAPQRTAVARAANLAAFLDQAARFTGLDGQSDLAAFLAYLEAAEAAEDGLDAGTVSTADTVKLMTVHKAKGLEWDVVAVPGLVDGVFPSSLGRPSWTSRPDVLPIPCRGDRDDLPTLTGLDAQGFKAFKAESDAGDDDEERRLAYVAFTRARRLLLASGYCWSGTRIKPVNPSPYLCELAGLGEPGVQVDRWCEDPEAGDSHPLQGQINADVRWPAPPDEEAIGARREAADRVRAAMSRLGDGTAAAVRVGDEGTGWRTEVALVLDEARRERRAVREVMLPRRLSASQVVELARDPDALARSLARPVPSRPVAQAARGSRFHAWVASLWQASPLLDTEDLPGAKDADLSEAQLAALQDRFAADGWAERRPVAVEQPFELVVAGRLLRGRIDAVYGIDADGAISADGDTTGGYDVIDYKTGEVPRDFAAASLQLAVYRLAWADLAGVDPAAVRAGFLYVGTGALKRPDRLLDRAELAAVLAGAG